MRSEPGQRLLGLMQRGPYDSIHSLRRRRFDPLANETCNARSTKD
jgi:hypothetical protein